jgi:hypothetical protein
MSRQAPRIKPFEPRRLGDAGAIDYVGALASVGFERRSREIPEALSVSGLAVPFEDHQELDFDANMAYFEGSGWTIDSPKEGDFFGAVSNWIGSNLRDDGATRLAVDVSSMSRLRIANVIEAALSLPNDVDLDLDFLYTPAEYEDYDEASEPPIFSVEPVSEYFAAWWTKLDRPLFAFVGLGYELEMASSALDMLEPEGAQAFVPEGSDSRYLDAVREANKGIGVWSPVDPEEVSYRVADPFACFRLLEARVSRMVDDHRIALIPLGPKIFAVIATIAGALHPRDVQVLRVTAGRRREAVPRRSDGDLFGLTLSLRRIPAHEESA